ncbi:hypothetical protein [Streptomyces tateyamensis]|uniref:hypothetical protein n=1 Tax=Streptomyces tateyamensis TaxID=565073 RepID=UPI0015E8AADD|nr:hypothetical protein [Streptomyces tateyamensis]
MIGLHRAVLVRAAVAALALLAACGGEHAVGHALAKRGAEQAAHRVEEPAARHGGKTDR